MTGDKRYELPNHLGNVLVVINDKKIPEFEKVDTPETGLVAFNADVLSYSDYYPFGMLQEARHGSKANYRYGFNGMEKDDELKGEGNSFTTHFRQYDSRVARWLSLDPLMAKYPHQSGYSGFNNSPIYYSDPTGLEGDPPVKTPVNKIQNIDADMVNSLVDMSGSKSKNTNSLGWPRDSKYYWEQFKDTPLGKSALSEDNLNLIEIGNSPKVDENWNNTMRKYDLDGKIGEGIEHHHHHKGRTAYPRPRSKHISKAWNNVLHKVEQRFGKIRQKSGYYSKMAAERGTLLRGKLGAVINLFNVADWLIDSPHSSKYMFGNSTELNRAYFDEGSGLYYEIKEINKKGDMKLQFFEDYERIEGEWRGIIKVDGAQWYNKQENDSYVKPDKM